MTMSTITTMQTEMVPLPRGNWAGPYEGRGARMTEAEVRASFRDQFKADPDLVLWVKPGMWVAGPVPSAAIANSGEGGQAPAAAAPPDEKPAAAPNLPGQLPLL